MAPAEPQVLPLDPAMLVAVQDPATQPASPAVPPVNPTTPDPGPDDKKPPTPVHTGFKALLYGLGEDAKHLPSLPNLYIAAVGGAAALAVHPLDDNVNTALRSHITFVNDVYKPGHIVGETPVLVGFSVVVYGVGRLMDKPKASHFGMDMIRAEIVASVLTTALKYTVRRERPDGSDNLSFPSGHAAETFALATVIERHLGWKMSVLGYAFASYVASSRLHDNVHWMSDVVFGAAVGTIAGRTVTEHGRNFWTFSPMPLPGGGVGIMATRVSGNTGSHSAN
ncbi:MAG TPA: phosphatase PAP2 family protein [Vicinamibacterales bacterium]|nr:phosphatase PAP2 family protein [Vicinamibacterales bacterium]